MVAVYPIFVGHAAEVNWSERVEVRLPAVVVCEAFHLSLWEAEVELGIAYEGDNIRTEKLALVGGRGDDISTAILDSELFAGVGVVVF